jgi:hypothetical protein
MSESTSTNVTHLVIYLAIPINVHHHIVDDAVSEACSLSNKISFIIREYGVHLVEIAHVKRINRTIRKHLQPHRMYEYRILTLSIKVPFSNSSPADRALIRDYILEEVFRLILCINIARPGAIEIWSCAVIQDGEIIQPVAFPRIDCAVLRSAVELSEVINWPNLRNIKLTVAWNWSNKHKNYFDGLDNTSMGRAISALSRLLEPTSEDEAVKLLWAMIGIETLYVKGKTAITEQVREKVQILLGEQTTYKKKIMQMYDFRSRFIHGDLDFPGLYMNWEIHTEVEKYSKDLLEAVSMAVAILIASLQEIIRRDWSGIDFTRVANNKPKQI